MARSINIKQYSSSIMYRVDIQASNLHHLVTFMETLNNDDLKHLDGGYILIHPRKPLFWGEEWSFHSIQYQQIPKLVHLLKLVLKLLR